MPDIIWEFDKVKPDLVPDLDLETRGLATAVPEGTVMTISLRIVPHKNGIPQLSIKEISFLIEHFDLDFESDEAPSWMVQLCYNGLQLKMKQKLQEAIVNIINDAIVSLIKSLNALTRGEFESVQNKQSQILSSFLNE